MAARAPWERCCYHFIVVASATAESPDVTFDLWYPPESPVDHAYQTIRLCRLVRNKRFLLIYDSLPIDRSVQFASLDMGPDDAILVQCRCLRPDARRWSPKKLAKLRELRYADEELEIALDAAEGDAVRAMGILSDGFSMPAREATSKWGDARRKLLDNPAALRSLMDKFGETDTDGFMLRLGLDPQKFESDPIQRLMEFARTFDRDLVKSVYISCNRDEGMARARLAEMAAKPDF
jgi:hypothetical protein